MLKFSEFRKLDSILQKHQGKVEFSEITPQQIKNLSFYREAGKAKKAIFLKAK